MGVSIQLKTAIPSRVEEIAGRPNIHTSAVTDSAGRFTFRSLPTGYKFSLIATKPDYLPEMAERVPVGSDPLTFRLKPVHPLGESQTQTIRGRVKRPDGSSLPGAVVKALVSYSGTSARMGSDSNSDTSATTDDAGFFTIRSAVTVDSLTGYVSAPGLARKAIRLTPGQDHEIVMSRGSTLTGRILHQGKPVSKLKVGITPREQRMDQSVGLFDAITTDDDGRFTFSHLPSDSDYTLYTKMEVTNPGIFVDRAVHVGGEHRATDVGEITLKRGLRLQGRILLESGGPLPTGSQLKLTRSDSKDHMVISLTETGAFDVNGLPPGLMHFYPRVPGYIVSKKNSSYSSAGFRLTGLVEKDILSLQVLLEETLPPASTVAVSVGSRGPTVRSYLTRPLEGIAVANQ